MIDGFEVLLTEPMDAAEQRVRTALGDEGFGVLADMDISGTLTARLGVARPALRIMAVCNPELAHRALEIDPSVSLLLPCNVVLAEDPNGTRVSAVNPMALLPGDELHDVAAEAAARLRRVVERLSPGASPSTSASA
jgi:uncharacterized protein (DUF302 family)